MNLRNRSLLDIPISYIVTCGVIAFILAFFGWMLAETELGWVERLQVSFYRALSVNTLSDMYGAAFFHEREIEGVAQWSLTIARFFGVATFTMLLVKAYQGLFSERFTKFLAGRLSGHMVVIGDTDFARATAEEASRFNRVVWASSEGVTRDQGNILRIVEAGTGNALVKATSATKARSVLIAMDDDTRTFTTTREMLHAEDIFGKPSEKENEHLEGPHFFAVVSDRWDAYPQEAADLINPPEGRAEDKRSGGLDSVGEFITEARTAARAALGNVPQFLLAGEVPQHVLIAGFGDFGEALLTEICESQRTDLYGLQRFTIIDRSRDAWTRFTSRVPDHAEVFESRFFELDLNVSDGTENKWRDLLAHISQRPLTAAYVTTGKANDSRLSASELRMRLLVACERLTAETSVETGEPGDPFEALAFPVFAYSRESVTEPIKRMPIISFGAWSEMVSAARVFDDEPDGHAFEIHATHHRLYAGKDQPVPKWRSLSEWQRYSSRSASAYTPALLHAAGYDLRAWYAEAQSSESAVTLNDLPRLATLQSLNEEPALMMKLARLEHARWCAERRLKGYRWGPRKDTARRHHPGLVDFDDLDEGAQRYNIEYIKSLFALLAGKDDKIVVDLRENAPRAITRPTDIALLKKLGMLSDTPSEPLSEHPSEDAHGDV
ncbi:MAG: RyR domain-containing protein [Pseudomonadota bacterium]